MPLQVGMEEGPSSKAVRISGLQYCLYSYEKISLITLLLDLVWRSCLCVLTKCQCLNLLERFYCLISAGDLLELVRNFQFSATFVHITQSRKGTSYVYHKP